VRAGPFSGHTLAVLLLCGGGIAVAQSVAVQSLGHRPFPNARDPPAYAPLNGEEQARFALGHAVFNTRWVPAGTPGAARRDGLGPLYNAAACDTCHNEGARGRGPTGAGPAPAALVMQLERPVADDAPDPVYGHVLNTAALNGVAPEAVVSIEYREIAGSYPDGTRWALRAPTYALSELRYGALAPDTILRPRIAPALFGIGLLEAVPQSAILEMVHGTPSSSVVHGTPAWREYRGARVLGRFGWQGASVSIRDQTTKAFSREMGLTSSDRPTDDCTIAETDCLSAPNGGDPEVSAELLDAVVAFEHALAVPESTEKIAGTMLPEFEQLGCADCHRPSLPVRLKDAAGHFYSGTIEPYTDLLLHELGTGLADSDVSGHSVRSRWRTAPLWGIAHNSRPGTPLTQLHDGRARSIEEAILWHQGEAESALRNFEHLESSQRQALIAWIETL
jgi:CxxC motif-containing protein (DUF1111 family)